MPGTKSGGLKAAQTNKERYGEGFYAKIGARGGQNGKTSGFYANRELARKAGKKGGKISRRGPAKPKPEDLDFAFIAEPVPTPPKLFSKIKRIFS